MEQIDNTHGTSIDFGWTDPNLGSRRYRHNGQGIFFFFFFHILETLRFIREVRVPLISSGTFYSLQLRNQLEEIY